MKCFNYKIYDNGQLILKNSINANSKDEALARLKEDHDGATIKIMEKFIKLLNSDEEYWQEKYKSLSNAYKKQLKLNIEQDREIRQLKKELNNTKHI